MCIFADTRPTVIIPDKSADKDKIIIIVHKIIVKAKASSTGMKKHPFFHKLFVKK